MSYFLGEVSAAGVNLTQMRTPKVTTQMMGSSQPASLLNKMASEFRVEMRVCGTVRFSCLRNLGSFHVRYGLEEFSKSTASTATDKASTSAKKDEF